MKEGILINPPNPHPCSVKKGNLIFFVRAVAMLGVAENEREKKG